MPFYRNFGAIRFETQTQTFEIFRADPHTTIFQSKTIDANLVLQTLSEFYQRHFHNNSIQFYQQANKGGSIVIPQCVPAQLNKANIDDLCKALLKATKIIIQICSCFPQLIGDFDVSLFRNINGKLAFIYLPTAEFKDSTKRDPQLVKGILKLASQIKDESNMSHQLLLKKISKSKNIMQIQEQINYFYSVYGVGTKSYKLNISKQQKAPVKKRKPQLKLNLFKSNSKDKSHGKLSLNSNSLHSSAPRKNNSFNIWMGKNKSNQRTVSNSCSNRRSPFNHSKLTTIDFNTSFHLEDKNNQSKTKKSLKKSKADLCQNIHTPVSTADQQKLLKKLKNNKTQQSSKKIEKIASQVDISIDKIEKQESIKVRQQNYIKQQRNSSKQVESRHKKTNNIQSNIVSIKFPSKQHIKQPPQINVQLRANPSKAIHKNQSTHISLPTQISQKKLKKKPVVREQQWGSQFEIVDLQKQPKQTSKTNPLKEYPRKSMNQTKEISIPKINIETNGPIEQGMQTRKNSWNTKSSVEETVRKNKKLTELIQKKRHLDYMGQTVVNTTKYLNNFQKIFWQLPLFFIYRSFYLLRVKLAKQLEPFEFQQCKQIMQQNDQIGQAVNKMIKVILKKLKKEDQSMLTDIKDALNIDQNISCQQAMKSLLGQYIQSLSESSADYSQLMQHQIEVVNSYLISKGNKLDFQVLEKLSSHSQRTAYLKSQLQKLKPYL